MNSLDLSGFYNLYTLSLAYSRNIESLEAVNLNDSRFIQQLNFSHANISRVNSGYFKGMLGIIMIDFSFNQIAAIDQDTFSSSCKLYILKLNNNQLVKVPKLNCMANLNLFDVSFNEIKEIGDIFKPGVFLFTLKVDHNQIMSLKEVNMGNLRFLRIFDASFNRIETLDGCGFENLINLEEVDLSHNQIKAVSQVRFNMNKLHLVYLSVGGFNLSELCAMQAAFVPKIEKVTLTEYYNAIYLIDRDYSNCRLSVYLIRFKIHFNLYEDYQVAECGEWLLEEFADKVRMCSFAGESVGVEGEGVTVRSFGGYSLALLSVGLGGLVLILGCSLINIKKI